MSKNLSIVAGLMLIIALSVIFSLKSVAPGQTTMPAQVGIKSVGPLTGLAAIFSADSTDKIISWIGRGLPKNSGVNINLLRKSSDSPAAYILVRQIAVNTLNDGKEVWSPLEKETGSDLYIEVTCSTSYDFNEGCSVIAAPVKAN